MKIRSPIARKRTRLEIIPLIDIMFFLLASFMMVSLQMQKVRTLKASLPTATLATSTKKPDIINLKVDRDGQVRIGQANCCPSRELAHRPVQPPSAQHQRSRLSQRQPRRHARRDDVCAGFRQTRRHPARGRRHQGRSIPPGRITMKNFQQNLFIVLALGLCGTVRLAMVLADRPAQHHRETRTRSFINNPPTSRATPTPSTHGRRNRRTADRITELKQTAMSNDHGHLTEKREVARLQSAGDIMSNEIVQYKARRQIFWKPNSKKPTTA